MDDEDRAAVSAATGLLDETIADVDAEIEHLVDA
jgi:hypothetical protein